MKLEDTLFRGAALRTPMERAIPPKIYAQFPFLRKSICVWYTFSKLAAWKSTQELKSQCKDLDKKKNEKKQQKQNKTRLLFRGDTSQCFSKWKVGISFKHFVFQLNGQFARVWGERGRQPEMTISNILPSHNPTFGPFKISSRSRVSLQNQQLWCQILCGELWRTSSGWQSCSPQTRSNRLLISENMRFLIQC